MHPERVRRVVTTTIPSPDPTPPEHRSIPMAAPSHLPASSTSSAGWVTFSYAQFGFAAFMAALGIWAMPVELMVKGYLMMSSVFLVGATFTLAKTVRDEHEAKRFAARLEEARTERLLMEVGRQ